LYEESNIKELTIKREIIIKVIRIEHKIKNCNSYERDILIASLIPTSCLVVVASFAANPS